MVKREIVGVHTNPTTLPRFGFYLRPPLILRTRSYVFRVHLDDFALKPH
jgi:hypothetical protein